MRNRYISLLFVLILFCSCRKDDGAAKITFCAVYATASRTVLNNESILWESGDEVKVLWGDNDFYDAVVRPYDSNRCAEFTAEVDPARAYYGVYPASTASSLYGGVLNLEIPGVQSGLFSDANISVALADEDNKMYFRHVVSFLEFSIDYVGTLSITGGESSCLAGKVSVNEFRNDGVGYTVTGKGNVVTVNIKSSGTYYLALLPDAKLDYLSLSLDDGTGNVMYASSSTSINMKAGKLVALGNITNRFSSSADMTLQPMEIKEIEFGW